jgi:hypothetical protein
VRILPEYGPRARVAIPSLIALLESRDADAAGLLGVLGDPVAIDPLARSLRFEDYRLRATALEALASFGADAASAIPAIEALTDNWAPVVRARAAAALHTIAGRDASEAHRSPRARNIIPTSVGWNLVAETGIVPLRVPHRSLPDGCAKLSTVLGTPFYGAVFGRSCIVTTFGIETSWLLEGDRETGKTRHLSGPGAWDFVVVHGRLFVIAFGGAIRAIDRAPDGSVKIEEVASGPGSPIAYGLDANGDLVVAASGSAAVDPSARPWPGGTYTYPGQQREDGSLWPTYVLRLTPEGQLVEVE